MSYGSCSAVPPQPTMFQFPAPAAPTATIMPKLKAQSNPSSMQPSSRTKDSYHLPIPEASVFYQPTALSRMQPHGCAPTHNPSPRLADHHTTTPSCWITPPALNYHTSSHNHSHSSDFDESLLLTPFPTAINSTSGPSLHRPSRVRRRIFASDGSSERSVSPSLHKSHKPLGISTTPRGSTFEPVVSPNTLGHQSHDIVLQPSQPSPQPEACTSSPDPAMSRLLAHKSTEDATAGRRFPRCWQPSTSVSVLAGSGRLVITQWSQVDNTHDTCPKRKRGDIHASSTIATDEFPAAKRAAAPGPVSPLSTIAIASPMSRWVEPATSLTPQHTTTRYEQRWSQTLWTDSAATHREARRAMQTLGEMTDPKYADADDLESMLNDPTWSWEEVLDCDPCQPTASQDSASSLEDFWAQLDGPPQEVSAGPNTDKPVASPAAVQSMSDDARDDMLWASLADRMTRRRGKAAPVRPSREPASTTDPHGATASPSAPCSPILDSAPLRSTSYHKRRRASTAVLAPSDGACIAVVAVTSWSTRAVALAKECTSPLKHSSCAIYTVAMRHASYVEPSDAPLTRCVLLCLYVQARSQSAPKPSPMHRQSSSQSLPGWPQTPTPPVGASTVTPGAPGSTLGSL